MYLILRICLQDFFQDFACFTKYSKTSNYSLSPYNGCNRKEGKLVRKGGESGVWNFLEWLKKRKWLWNGIWSICKKGIDIIKDFGTKLFLTMVNTQDWTVTFRDKFFLVRIIEIDWKLVSKILHTTSHVDETYL